ncbi:hypothetical protein GCM10027275_10090 [Rhabdobacter roseus]|uniref:CheY-like chemotaxis protein n=1 Tax=Rhabdobacter roseus TaxID=1655419 RepID=A0A840TMZ5_9BACT|nr:response regulator [Rhabdobacter roseus]MBB5282912.1 CheY-like chemotaxis protein [Rhabdobacter roseus]
MMDANSSGRSTLRILDGVRILVVEDNLFNTLAINAYLRHWGCDMDHASNGIEALQRLNPSHHLVLMDIHMPEMDGLEATHLLRLRGETLPIIALTADYTLDEQQDIYGGGFSAILYKPIKPRELLDQIQQFTGQPSSMADGVADELLP